MRTNLLANAIALSVVMAVSAYLPSAVSAATSGTDQPLALHLLTNDTGSLPTFPANEAALSGPAPVLPFIYVSGANGATGLDIQKGDTALAIVDLVDRQPDGSYLLLVTFKAIPHANDVSYVTNNQFTTSYISIKTTLITRGNYGQTAVHSAARSGSTGNGVSPRSGSGTGTGSGGFDAWPGRGAGAGNAVHALSASSSRFHANEELNSCASYRFKWKLYRCQFRLARQPDRQRHQERAATDHALH